MMTTMTCTEDAIRLPDLPLDIFELILGCIKPEEVSHFVSALSCTSKEMRCNVLEAAKTAVQKLETPNPPKSDSALKGRWNAWLAWASRTFPNARDLALYDPAYCKIPEATTDVGAEHAAAFLNVEVLKLYDWLDVTSKGLATLLDALAAHGKIRELDLSGVEEVHKIMPRVAKLRSLESLTLEGKELPRSAILHISKMTWLKSLRIPECYCIEDEKLHLLSTMTHLEELNLGHPGMYEDAVNDFGSITNDGVGHLTRLPRLKVLNLDGAYKVTDVGAEHLSKIETLEVLHLEEVSLTTVGLEYIVGRLKRLRELSVCKRCRDEWLELLTRVRRTLTCLKFHGTMVTDWGFQHLSKLTGLVSLTMYDCINVTDEGLGHLSKLTGLKSLTLCGCTEITDEGLEHLSKLRNLTQLRLFCPESLTRAGVDKMLEKNPWMQDIDLRLPRDV